VPAAQFRIERLDKHHDRAAFSCGEEPLDRYLREQARKHAELRVAAAFVLFDADEQLIAGYYTLSAVSVLLSDLPEDVAKKLPRYPNIPAGLMGRLAIDERYQGQKVGAVLLVDALKRALGATEEIGAVAVVVDAKNDLAKSFYMHFGFRQFSDDPNRLFIAMKTIGAIP
jgi:GNAT superfamily N-acetyltransferase